MGLETGVNLIVASLDLQLVRLLRGAMNNGPAGVDGGLHPAPAIGQRPRLDPEPVIEPRERITPTPHFEPRPILHPAPRWEAHPDSTVPVEPDHAASLRGPIEPPWKTLPWEAPLPVAPKIKITLIQPDIVSKGMLIDFFI